MKSKPKNESFKPDTSACQSRRRVQRGFTFMELLIVMVIIAILAAVAIPKYLAHLRRAKEVVLMHDL